MNIVFMGSPEFALPVLKKLHASEEHQIICVYTQPPKKSGRGYKIKETPIHKYALENNLEVRTPKNFKATETIQELSDLKHDVNIVVAYGLILPEAVLKSAKYGSINLHPSSLPKHRGAAPIQRTILAGEKKSSICTIMMDTGIDTGDILLEQNITLADDITTKQLHDQTSELGAELVLQTINKFHKIIPRKQSSIGASYAHKITKEEGHILFQKDTIEDIDKKIRALNPSPGTYFYIKETKIIISSASVSKENHNKKIGTINNKFEIACINGILTPLILKREGKQEMKLSDFLRGFTIPYDITLS